MTRTQAQILELFETLDSRERLEIAEQLYAAAGVPSFYERMSPEQRSELLHSISEADHGEGEEANMIFRRLKAKHGLTDR